jgi:hypothetical protein
VGDEPQQLEFQKVTTMIRTLVFGAALATLTSAAVAQPVYVQHRGPVYGEAYEPGPYSPAYGRQALCQRWCPQDASPCDPPYFKIADSRCRPTMNYR